MTWASLTTDLLWRNALAVVPLTVLVALACRWIARRPATRHSLWLLVLLWFLAPVVLPTFQWPGALQAGRASEPPEPQPAAAGPMVRVNAGGVVAREEAPPALLPPNAAARDVPRHSGASLAAAIPEPRLPPDVWVPGEPAAGTSAPAGAARGGGASSGSYSRSARTERHVLAPAPSSGGHDSHEIAPTAAYVWQREAREPSSAVGPPAWLARAFPRLTPREVMRSTPARRRETPETPLLSSSAEAVAATQRDLERVETLVASSAAAARAEPDVDAGRRGSATMRGVSDEWRSLRAALAQFADHWLTALVGVRDAIGRLPALPPAVWCVGLGAVGLAVLIQLASFRRILKTAQRGSAETRRLVADVSRAMGLSAAPEVWMVRRRVPPMIWSGRPVRLILPSGLWDSMDELSRRAIVSHELAHLRRRDHWVRWVELLALSLFWWHPVLWMVRWRLHEEAELCCDAWVMWLLPQGRRSYAEALLRTKDYLSRPAGGLPELAIGMTSGRARRFARRLTMVMTQNTRPGSSIAGMALAIGLMGAAWIVTPAWATGDDDKCKSTAAVAATECAQAAAPVAAQETAAGLPVPINVRRNVSSPPVAMTRRSPVVAVTYAGGGDDVEQRLSRVERRLEEIAERLERMTGQTSWGVFGGAGGGAGLRPGRAARSAPQPTPPFGPFGGMAPGAPTTPAPPAAPMFGRTPYPGAAPRGGGMAPGGPAIAVPEPEGGDGIIVRFYPLPEGKAEALGALMVREDVPVRVAPKDDGIEVHATERQHRIFKAFVDMIHPEGRGASAVDEPSSPDVALLPQAVIAAPTREALELMAERQRDHSHEMENQARDVQREMEKLQREVGKLNERAARMFERANSARERDEDAARAQADTLEARAREMEEHARALEQRAAELERAAEDFERRADAMEADADTIEGAARSLRGDSEADAELAYANALLAAQSFQLSQEAGGLEALRAAELAQSWEADTAATRAMLEAYRCRADDETQKALLDAFRAGQDEVSKDSIAALLRSVEQGGNTDQLRALLQASRGDDPQASATILRLLAEAAARAGGDHAADSADGDDSDDADGEEQPEKSESTDTEVR
ncbi:MAG: hypothetical protein CHACPFDD_02965 [Phycisphaerae bacterium]|nr:hypothetical protein [Phycisphaerae bacterium]